MHRNAEFSEEDKSILSSMGYDVSACIGRGATGNVFNGICNSNATKLYPIDANEAQRDPENVVYVQDKPYREVGLRGKTFAVKAISRNNEVIHSTFRKEANIMQDLHHPNVVEVYNVVTLHLQRIYIIMEYLDSGTLKEMLFERKTTDPRFNEMQAKLIITQLTDGLQYLHNQNIVHNDIHSGNIMFTKIPNSGLRLKYVDFGFSKARTIKDSVEDIVNLGVVLSFILTNTSFTTIEFQKKLEKITIQMSNRGYMDMNTVARALTPIYPSFYNPFVRLPSGKWDCDLM